MVFLGHATLSVCVFQYKRGDSDESLTLQHVRYIDPIKLTAPQKVIDMVIESKLDPATALGVLKTKTLTNEVQSGEWLLHYLTQILQAPASSPDLPEFKSTEALEQIRVQYLNMLSALPGQAGDVPSVPLCSPLMRKETGLLNLIKLMDPTEEVNITATLQIDALRLGVKNREKNAIEKLCAALHYSDQTLIAPGTLSLSLSFMGCSVSCVYCVQSMCFP